VLVRAVLMLFGFFHLDRRSVQVTRTIIVHMDLTRGLFGIGRSSGVMSVT
jgi:hypothetical protein